MDINNKNELLDIWLSVTHIQLNINEELERALQAQYNLTLKEFYVLHFISQSQEKKLRLQQLQDMIGLSQSAISRLVGRMEAKNCGALQRHVCQDDRRGIYTCITEIGETKLKKALVTFEEVLKATLAQDQLKAQLQSLIEDLD